MLTMRPRGAGSLRLGVGVAALSALLLSTCKTMPSPANAVSSVEDLGDKLVEDGNTPVACRTVENYQGNVRDECDVPVPGGRTQKLTILKLKGTFKEVSYAHGRLMADETDDGVFGEMAPKVRDGLGKAPAPVRTLATCLVNRLEKSVSTEFSEAMQEFFRGYQGKPRQDGRAHLVGPGEYDLFKTVALGIELENISDGIIHRFTDNRLSEIDSDMLHNLTKNGNAKKLLDILASMPFKDLMQGLKDLAKECGPTAGDKLADEVLEEIAHPTPLDKARIKLAMKVAAYLLHSETVYARLKAYAEAYLPHGPHKFACTGFVSPATEGSLFLHARNLDADTVRSWNRHPTLYFVREVDREGKPYAAYVAPGTAGMFYTGGVGGMNEFGITTSLHQMYTNHYAIGYPGPEGEIGPFTNQRVLRTAKSIDDAERIIRKEIKHFGAWTEHIGDAKTNDILSIEMSADGVGTVVDESSAPNDPAAWRRIRASTRPMVQTNHFLSNIKDAAYTPFFNKALESRSRFQFAEAELAKHAGLMNVDYALGILSGHYDMYEERLRSFGRTPAKAYGVMSTIMVPKMDASFTGERMSTSEFWMTVGETTADGNFQSASHSTLVGFDIDWANMAVMPKQPTSTKRIAKYDAYPDWVRSLGLYIAARHAYLGGDRMDDYHVKPANPAESVALLSEAITAAEADKAEAIRHDEPYLPYYFMRARIQHELGKYAEAAVDWQVLWKKYEYLGWTAPKSYQRALVALYSVITARTMGQPLPDENERLQNAVKIFAEDGVTVPFHHPDLEKKVRLANALLKEPNYVPKKLQSVDFVFVE